MTVLGAPGNHVVTWQSLRRQRDDLAIALQRLLGGNWPLTADPGAATWARMALAEAFSPEQLKVIMREARQLVPGSARMAG